MSQSKYLFLAGLITLTAACTGAPPPSENPYEFLKIAGRSKILFLGEAHTYASPLEFLAGNLESLYRLGYRVLVLENSSGDPEAYLYSQITGNLTLEGNSQFSLYPGTAANGSGTAWRSLAQAYFRLKERYPEDPLRAVSAEPLGQVTGEIRTGALDQGDSHKVLNRRDELGAETVNRLAEEIPDRARILILMGAGHGLLQDQDLTPDNPADGVWTSLARRLKPRWGDRFMALGTDLNWDRRPPTLFGPDTFIPAVVTQQDWEKRNPGSPARADAWLVFPHPVFDVPLELASDPQTFRRLVKQQIAAFQAYADRGNGIQMAPLITAAEYSLGLAEAYYSGGITQTRRAQHSRAFSAGMYYFMIAKESSSQDLLEKAEIYMREAWNLFPDNKIPAKILAEIAMTRKRPGDLAQWKAELEGTPWEKDYN